MVARQSPSGLRGVRDTLARDCLSTNSPRRDHVGARPRRGARLHARLPSSGIPSTVRFFVDDTVHYAVTRGEVEHIFLILNLAVGGTFDGDPKSDAIFPATMLVDYVRVYKAAH